MTIHIQGAAEHNLKDVDVAIGDGLTVVTGVSGSGKTSLVFDTLYHEARRRFLEIFSLGSTGLRLSPANVQSISGIGPAIAVGQNLLNRNPNSTLATASGLHPFLRLLYANFGERRCPHCGHGLVVLAEDAIVERLLQMAGQGPVTVFAPLVRGVPGSHRTLLAMLVEHFGAQAVHVDGQPRPPEALDPALSHDIAVTIAELDGRTQAAEVREAAAAAAAMGTHAVMAESGGVTTVLSRAPVCAECGAWFGDLKPLHFHTPCAGCGGEGCDQCDFTGLHPQAAAVTWGDLRLPHLLAQTVDEARALFGSADLPSTAGRLCGEITRRLDALERVGLGYIGLDRPAPTLSRGEAQRVRLAVALTSRLEDMLHVLDEPTIGQHPADIDRLVAAFRDLAGPVVFVEHERIAAAAADHAIDLGPGAGQYGGEVVFSGTPAELWQAETATGRYFSMRERVALPSEASRRPEPSDFLTMRGASLRNLRGIDVPIPLGRLTVVTGVSGSGKSTLVEDVLVASLSGDEAVGCAGIEGRAIKPVFVDQSPIGRNPRSNPATYTRLSDIIRDRFAAQTGLSASHFSFNRPEGACPVCEGMGALEVKMRYLPSTWIPCAACDGRRFNDEVLARRAQIGRKLFSIADIYEMPIAEAAPLLLEGADLPAKDRRAAGRILRALEDIGLGYLALGQPSPTLSGGEAQRIKLAKYLGRRSLEASLLVLDEPSTGLHPRDLAGLLAVLDRLVRAGATIVVVEHNSDVMRAADWIIDLGPGAGPNGGDLLYAGPPERLVDVPGSVTGQALRREEEQFKPMRVASEQEEVEFGPPTKQDKNSRNSCNSWITTSLPSGTHPTISIRGARAHNLKNVDVDIPKAALTVVTGVSGSGKSSLVGDVLEAEARRRFLESLSLYERQSTREGPEAPVDAVSGLGVAVTITPERHMYNRRSTVGVATEISHHLATLMAAIGERECLACGATMQRDWAAEVWRCPQCASTAPLASSSRFFSTSNFASACRRCNGVGSLQAPAPEKLIIAPEKPLCGGAMYSPGFFPKGYLCEPFNGGYYVVQALARHYGFDPAATPWNAMTAEAQQAFLFGCDEPLDVHYVGRTGIRRDYQQTFTGFYGWIGDWDVGGTYTYTELCPECGGARLRPEYLAVRLGGCNIHELSEMTLSSLGQVVETLNGPEVAGKLIAASLRTVRRRLRFLRQVGLGYLHLNRVSATLSAGEAQRVRLAGLLGSELTALTVLLDEPSRGMHPAEVSALLGALGELRDAGNTVIVVEHDPVIIRAADYLIDMGPGSAGVGGQVVAQGTPEQVAASENGSLTGKWLRGEREVDTSRPRRKANGWMTIRGARAHNLRGDDVRIPLVTLTGVCGVSGSGKSTLLIDTLGRVLVPKKHTTSVAHEPIDPGEHDAVEGAPERAILLDQSRRGIGSPMAYLGLDKPLLRLFAESGDARAIGMDEKALAGRCAVCGGSGSTRIEMGFLPDVHVECDACRGTGYRPEAWAVRLHGLALPEANSLTIDEVYECFGSDDENLARRLEMARAVGLGYLVMRQPGYALSGGEAQRLKIAGDLYRKTSRPTLYILDEPTLGQHLEDVARLTGVLHRLVDAGHSVVVIEHHTHLLAACDWLIELGPGGGPDGGRVIAAGTPETVAAGKTPTASYVRDVMHEKTNGQISPGNS
ncbi:MAG: ATP-binding cassette domain-containing protein [Anaerolineae bacterium]|nr:ATP-binding cassette domain-containing protein [Anaerolineae bacterium]